MSNRFKNSFVSSYSDENSAKEEQDSKGEQAKSNTNSENSNDGFSKTQLYILKQLIVDELSNGVAGDNFRQLFEETGRNNDLIGCLIDKNLCGDLLDN